LGTQGGQLIVRNTSIGSNSTGKGQESGSVFIRAGRFELKDGFVWGTRSESHGGVTDIRANDVELQAASITSDANGADSSLGAHNAGNIHIEARRITINDGAGIHSSPLGTGKGGSIVIQVEEDLTISNGSILGGMFSPQTTENSATNIHIEARQIVLNKDAYIVNGTFGGRNGGDITIQVTDDLTMSGGIISSGATTKEGIKAGDAGNIEISAHQLTLQEGAIIDSTNDKVREARREKLR
jgi:hypothetical protein